MTDRRSIPELPQLTASEDFWPALVGELLGISAAESATLERAIVLRDWEVQLRERGRRAELHPQRREAAVRLFRRANGLRRLRLALLERCGLR